MNPYWLFLIVPAALLVGAGVCVGVFVYVMSAFKE